MLAGCAGAPEKPSAADAAGAVNTAAAPTAVPTVAAANAAPAQDPSTGSGQVLGSLQIKDTVIGSGAEAVAGKMATVHYTGRLLTGKQFDSSVGRAPFPFLLGGGRVIKGWDMGVAGMKVGGKRQLVIPPHLAYGAGGAGDGLIPPNATLVFDVELLGVE
jgi:FKBP-type peptidyl-prolyl cis-trans isomerase